MADSQPLDHYLNDLRDRVAPWHRRPDELVDEAADHLMERIDELERDGLDPQAASVRAIGEYGSPVEVADAHLRAARRPAIPTDDTRTMGIVAMVGGAGWIVLPLLTSGLPDVRLVWIALASLFHVTIAASLFGCIGLWRRHGGLGPLGFMAMAPALAAVPFVMFVWPIPAWTILLGIATSLFGLAVLLRRLAPLAASLGLAFGLALAAGAVIVAELTVGPHGEDYAFLSSTSASVLMIVGMIVFGAGLIGTGWWMQSEEPVELPALPAPSITT